MGDCEPRNFLQPCLLLLLRERSDHGYDLVNRLRVLHAVDGDAGAVYRALRGLEKAGMVRSSWQTSEAGPARRTYQVTPLGIATLDRQADILEETHRTLHLFQQRYRLLTGELDNEHPHSGHPVGTNGGIGTCGVGDGLQHGNANGGGDIGAAGNGAGGNCMRKDGNGGGTAGAAHGDGGGRGVRPAQLPGQRTGS
jgi:PadR family transcriptional regulator PadR